MKVSIEMEPHELRDLIAMGVNGFQPPTRTVIIPEATPREIRAWAKSRGMKISSKGYVPKDVTAMFYEERRAIGG